ncbi:MAG: DbpA RNA binding domain-containing protein [Treponemataceae bacterium]
MSFKNDDNFEADYAAMLQEIVAEVKLIDDPVRLDNLKKIYKKNVPFTLRNYVATFVTQKGLYSFRKESYRKNNNQGNNYQNKWNRSRTQENGEQRPPAQKVYIDEEHAATIFIGIGKSRHVFPRDLLGLVMNVADLGRDRVGFIRVLENFSFVQLFKEDADAAIEKLNGYEYRGRKLPVSYSKKREESSSNNLPPEDSEFDNDNIDFPSNDDANDSSDLN